MRAADKCNQIYESLKFTEEELAKIHAEERQLESMKQQMAELLAQAMQTGNMNYISEYNALVAKHNKIMFAGREMVAERKKKKDRYISFMKGLDPLISEGRWEEAERYILESGFANELDYVSPKK